MWDDFPAAPKWNVMGKVRRSETGPSVPVTLDGPGRQPGLPGMLGASNIRRILPDTPAILVWHAVFSSLWNTFKAITDMPARTPGIFSQVLQHQVTVFTPRMCMPLVCLVNMSHLSVTNLQHHLWSSASSRLFPSVALTAARTGSVKVWGDVCVCLSLDVEATGLLSGALTCSEDRDTVFIYPSPSCHCCVWSEFAELRATLGELSNPPTL